MRRPRRTIVLGTSLFACLHGGTPCLLRSQREDARSCPAGERKRLHGGTPCLLLVCKLTKFFSNSRIFDEEFLAKPQGTQRKRSNISLGPALTLPTRPLQADACLRVHESDARAPFKTVHSPPFGGRGLGVGLWGGAFFLAKPQRTQRNKHGLAHTTKQSVLVCERPWQMITATDKHGLARTTFSASMDIFRGLDMLFHFV